MCPAGAAKYVTDITIDHLSNQVGQHMYSDQFHCCSPVNLIILPAALLAVGNLTEHPYTSLGVQTPH